MVTGIYAGDPDRMSLRSCFPLIYNLESKYGGLVRGMLSLKRERAKEGVKTKMSAGPGGVLVSFDDGVQALADELASPLADGLHLNVTVDRVERREGSYVLHISEKGLREEIEADILVVATPAYEAVRILSPLDEELVAALSSIPYSPITVAALGYDAKTLGNPLDGFGFLIPGSENGRSSARCGTPACSRTGRRRERRSSAPWWAASALRSWPRSRRRSFYPSSGARFRASWGSAPNRCSRGPSSTTGGSRSTSLATGRCWSGSTRGWRPFPAST